MPFSKPEKRQRPKPPTGSKPLSAHAGMRYIPSQSLSPANLLQLQRTAGNRFVSNLLQAQSQGDRDDPAGHTWNVVRAARRDKITPEPRVKSEEIMAARHPQYGDWNFQFVVDSLSHRTVMYWITLNHYHNRQRHVLIDPITLQPNDLLGSDLGPSERAALLEWAMQFFYEQMSGNIDTKQRDAGRKTKHELPPEEETTPLPEMGDDDE